MGGRGPNPSCRRNNEPQPQGAAIAPSLQTQTNQPISHHKKENTMLKSLRVPIVLVVLSVKSFAQPDPCVELAKVLVDREHFTSTMSYRLALTDALRAENSEDRLSINTQRYGGSADFLNSIAIDSNNEIVNTDIETIRQRLVQDRSAVLTDDELITITKETPSVGAVEVLKECLNRTKGNRRGIYTEVNSAIVRGPDGPYREVILIVGFVKRPDGPKFASIKDIVIQSGLEFSGDSRPPSPRTQPTQIADGSGLAFRIRQKGVRLGDMPKVWAKVKDRGANPDTLLYSSFEIRIITEREDTKPRSIGCFPASLEWQREVPVTKQVPGTNRVLQENWNRQACTVLDPSRVQGDREFGGSDGPQVTFDVQVKYDGALRRLVRKIEWSAREIDCNTRILRPTQDQDGRAPTWLRHVGSWMPFGPQLPAGSNHVRINGEKSLVFRGSHDDPCGHAADNLDTLEGDFVTLSFHGNTPGADIGDRNDDNTRIMSIKWSELVLRYQYPQTTIEIRADREQWCP
jgi:hypothetical protein